MKKALPFIDLKELDKWENNILDCLLYKKLFHIFVVEGVKKNSKIQYCANICLLKTFYFVNKSSFLLSTEGSLVHKNDNK